MAQPSTGDPVRVARELADRLLAPHAERVDVEGVERGTVDALGAAGLLGLAGPRAYGGADAAPAVLREVTEVLAGADGATWFVTTQHDLPLKTLSGSANVALKERHLRDMCTGTALAGVAIAHVRRPGRPAVLATPAPGGWRFDGKVSWTTSWGLADLLLLGGVSTDGRLVLALLPARPGPGITASAPLRLAAMQATATVALTVDGLVVKDTDTVEVLRAEQWLEADRLKTANPTPAVFGLVAAIVGRLAALPDATARLLGERLREEAADLRHAAYALIDHVAPQEQVDDRLALRAAALELANRAATALVAASGGSAMARDRAPQRLAREAMFYLVQAQTAPVREATLQRLLERTP